MEENKSQKKCNHKMKKLEKSQAWCHGAIIPSLRYRCKKESGVHGQFKLPETLSHEKNSKT